MTTAIVENDLKSLLEAHGGDYVAVYNAIVRQEERKALVRHKAGSNIEARKDRWKNAVKKRDKNALDRIGAVLAGYLDVVRRNNKITAAEPHVLTETEAKSLIIEKLNNKNGKEFLAAREEEIKAAFFASMDLDFAREYDRLSDGEKEVALPPELWNGSIAVKVNGIDYEARREGAGVGDPGVDEHKLRELIGDDAWEKVTTEVTTRVFDMDKFLSKARIQTTLLERLREALIPGEPKKGRFIIREIKTKE